MSFSTENAALRNHATYSMLRVRHEAGLAAERAKAEIRKRANHARLGIDQRWWLMFIRQRLSK